MGDSINHPNYYGGENNVYETIKVIDAWGLDESFALGNVVKYISRAGKKDPAKKLEDLKKARFYLDHEIAKLEKKNTQVPEETTSRVHTAPIIRGSGD